MCKGLKSTIGFWLSVIGSLITINPTYAVSLQRNSGTEPIKSTNKPIFLSRLNPVFTFTAGAFISQQGQPQSFQPIDLCSYHYTPSNANTTNMLWGGFIGADVTHTSKWGIITGVGYYQPTSLSTTGTLTQGADSLSNNTYQYRYQTQNQQLLAEGKLYWIAHKKIRPFVMFGIGAAFNNTSDYNTNVPSFLEFTPTFSAYSQTNFTYAVGPGVDMTVSKSLRVGVGYRYADFGSVNTSSGQIDGIAIPNALHQHLYANQVVAQFTFVLWDN